MNVLKNETNLIVEAIKDWMKRNAQKEVPGYKQITDGLKLSKNYLTSYTYFKNRAFRELEAAGYILEYTNDGKSIAKVISYKVPEGSSGKTAEKMLHNINEAFTQEPSQHEEAKEKQRPPFLLYIKKENASPSKCEHIGQILQAVSGFPQNTEIKIMISIKEVSH